MSNDQAPKINLLSLIRRTVEKVIVAAGIAETDAAARLVASCLINIAAVYIRTIGDPPDHIETLFHTFLTGSVEQQKEAVRLYGESGLRKEKERFEENGAT
jgi:hypothetical protein